VTRDEEVRPTLGGSEPSGAYRSVQTVAVPGIQTGSYSLARTAAGVLYVSGMIPVDADGRLVSTYARLPPGVESQLRTGVLPTDLRDERIVCQAWAVYDGIRKVLEFCGSSLQQILRQRIYLVDLGEFYGLERVRNHVFGAEPPPTTTVGVTGLVIPDVRLEIEVEAMVEGLELDRA
jgi:enamine deaminase RidA (YjgF/YER057c/UK114 family)